MIEIIMFTSSFCGRRIEEVGLGGVGWGKDRKGQGISVRDSGSRRE